jgi:hypothetical protein
MAAQGWLGWLLVNGCTGLAGWLKHLNLFIYLFMFLTL